ncbi:uncharacterized protein LOC143243968 [Tachypleus tridentatus]|uniref:uncharacterized protein LOC143243968 n=1 Tax=Tachypleus tridentatus TaxID=6853 RepID=UPI003FD30B5B
MKRQHDMPEFVRKTPRTETLKQDTTGHQASATSRSDETSAFNTVQTRDDEHPATALLDCWSMKQAKEFKEKYDGLVTHTKKLGCDHFVKFDSINMKGIHISMEWRSYSVEASGRSKTIQQTSLRQKMNEHFSS